MQMIPSQKRILHLGLVAEDDATNVPGPNSDNTVPTSASVASPPTQIFKEINVQVESNSSMHTPISKAHSRRKLKDPTHQLSAAFASYKNMSPYE